AATGLVGAGDEADAELAVEAEKALAGARRHGPRITADPERLRAESQTSPSRRRAGGRFQNGRMQPALRRRSWTSQPGFFRVASYQSPPPSTRFAAQTNTVASRSTIQGAGFPVQCVLSVSYSRIDSFSTTASRAAVSRGDSLRQPARRGSTRTSA